VVSDGPLRSKNSLSRSVLPVPSSIRSPPVEFGRIIIQITERSTW